MTILPLSHFFQRNGFYKTDDVQSRQEEIAKLRGSKSLSPAIREFVCDQIELILNSESRMKTLGRFSCIGATTVWEKGRSYFADFDGRLLVEDRAEQLLVLEKLEWFARQERISEYSESALIQPQETELFNSVFYAVIDVHLSSHAEGVCYFAHLLKSLHKLDATRFAVAKGYSRDPLDPLFIVSIAETPYFVNISHPFESHDHQSSSAAAIMFVPQVVFEHQKRKVDSRDRSQYLKWSEAIRKNLSERYGSAYPGLNNNGQRSALANFLFYRDEEVEAVANALDLDNSKVPLLRQLLEPQSPEIFTASATTAGQAPPRCPFHFRKASACLS